MMVKLMMIVMMVMSPNIEHQLLSGTLSLDTGHILNHFSNIWNISLKSWETSSSATEVDSLNMSLKNSTIMQPTDLWELK